MAKFLQAIDWSNPGAVREAHSLLADWGTLEPKDALELLDARYADERVRMYAVQCLDAMSDEELELYMLQLVQVLKYEQFHDSALARFLMVRSLQCPNVIGHLFFWYLKVNDAHSFFSTWFFIWGIIDMCGVCVFPGFVRARNLATRHRLPCASFPLRLSS